MLIDSTTDFLLNDFNSWIPTPNERRDNALIPEIASSRFLWSFTEKLFWTDTKYDSFGTKPPIGFWLFVV